MLEYVIGGIILCILICVFLGRFFFVAQTPEFYAIHSIEGRRPSDAITYISYSIWKECNFVLNKKVFRQFEHLAELAGKTTNWPMSKKNIKAIENLSNKINSRFDEINKIDYMIVSLAKELNIPAHRLSDYLFQFSPEIFILELRKILHYMTEIYNTLDEKTESERRKYLTGKIENFTDSVRKRSWFQESVIEYKNLHDTLIGMTSGFGLTNALEAYCLGIQNTTLEVNPSTIIDRGKQQKVTEKLTFLYHKRRLFPGFDLHAILYNYTCQILEEDNENVDIKNLQKTILDLAGEGESKNGLNYVDAKECLPSLKGNIGNYITEQRAQIQKYFRDFIKEELVDSDASKLVFITQGFSTVVNETLYSFARTIVSDSEWAERLRNVDVYYYILLCPDEMDNSHLTTSRYVRYNFKAYPNIPFITKNKVNVKVGDKDWLEKRFSRSDCRNYVLSGAEFYQKGERGYRLINNEGFHDLEDKASAENIGLNPKHIVLAERFKEFPRPLQQNDLRKKAFNHDHLEYTHLYKWSPNRIIINGDEILRPFEKGVNID